MAGGGWESRPVCASGDRLIHVGVRELYGAGVKGVCYVNAFLIPYGYSSVFLRSWSSKQAKNPRIRHHRDARGTCVPFHFPHVTSAAFRVLLSLYLIMSRQFSLPLSTHSLTMLPSHISQQHRKPLALLPKLLLTTAIILLIVILFPPKSTTLFSTLHSTLLNPNPSTPSTIAQRLQRSEALWQKSVRQRKELFTRIRDPETFDLYVNAMHCCSSHLF